VAQETIPPAVIEKILCDNPRRVYGVYRGTVFSQQRFVRQGVAIIKSTKFGSMILSLLV
jgi:hypothetical protein